MCCEHPTKSCAFICVFYERKQEKKEKLLSHTKPCNQKCCSLFTGGDFCEARNEAEKDSAQIVSLIINDS